MLKNISLLFLIVLLAWLTKDFFSITLPTQSTHIEKSKEQEVVPPKPSIIIDNNSSKNLKKKGEALSLSDLLQRGLFYDALAFYLEDTSVENMKTIESYLSTLSQTEPRVALEYMQVFLENEPESNVLKMMIETYIALEELPKAIELIMLVKENYVSEEEDRRLDAKLKEVAVQHIDNLMQREEYAELIAFLEEMIAYESEESYYKFRLAKLYMKLDKVDEAGALLDVIQYDEVYAQNVQSLLNVIEQEQQESYDYAIPLQNYGSHYVVQVTMDGNLFNLMLDTGATYIFVDEQKASMIEVIADDLVLQTVSSDISAKLGRVGNFSAGNLYLQNIEVTMGPFDREGIDGLLGMNFFRQFKFYIDQEESVLYLNPK
jgi:predicted aspartyl protease